MAGNRLSEQIDISKMTDSEVDDFLKKNKIGLTVAEVRKISSMLCRDPTLTECVIWGIQGSEHSSYRSSWKELKKLPKSASNVILSQKEDAGIVGFADIRGERYCIVISHESHNHPSQIVPYEGAATGIGGNVRDVLCMGAKVIGNADALRFGDPAGRAANTTKIVSEGVVSGIAGYSNAIGVPNIGGDIYFNGSNDSNCLVNVISLGLVKEKEIIHSFAPASAGVEGHDIIVVGKPTDNSGMGGASFASAVLDDCDKESNKGAVQEPNPFLKRHLFESTHAVFSRVRELGLTDNVGFKDMGAGGIMCATVELVDSAGLGAEIDVSKIHVALPGLHPSVIACSETQERFAWVVPKSFTSELLKIYNEDYALPSVSEGAMASVVGEVKAHDRYVLKYGGKVICDARTKDVTEGLRYHRVACDPLKAFDEPVFDMPNLSTSFLSLMGSKNICSRKHVFEQYDKQVQGNVVLEAGLADASVIAPLACGSLPNQYKQIGCAFSVDGNPFYGRISPYWQAANAVAESLRNIACVGAEPMAITDCCNYGNPEDPSEYWEYCEGIRGLDDACRLIGLKGGEPIVPVAGNVSFYNFSDSADGRKAIDPTMVISAIGKVRDCADVVTPWFKGSGNVLFLVGARKDELGASEYYSSLGYLGKNVPTVDLELLRREIDALIDCIEIGSVESCHDISEGGLLCCVGEMVSMHLPKFGAHIRIDEKNNPSCIREDAWLFSQTGGFVLEVAPEKQGYVRFLFKKYGVPLFEIGTTTKKQSITVMHGNEKHVDVSVSELNSRWHGSLKEVLR